PLPDGIRRWIVQLPPGIRSAELDAQRSGRILAEWVYKRAGIRLPEQAPLWWSVFQPERSEADAFSGHRIMLIGDAAHTMSPIGGQGMNTGIADAELAADLISRFLSGKDRMREVDRTYARVRRRAARIAADRAALSMRTGIRSGKVVGSVRDVVLRALLWLFPDRVLASHFAMLTIPGGRSPYRRTLGDTPHG
ncbi:MAG: FAD-dependent oxidoreductase, partial [Spirochaetales bacterium]